MAIIKAPNKNYSGVSATVSFIKGEGKTDDTQLIAWFKAKGYEVTEEVKSEDSDKLAKEAEKAELKAKAESLGIDVVAQWGVKKLTEVIAAKEAELAAGNE